MPVPTPASYRRRMEAVRRETRVRPGAFEQDVVEVREQVT
jgi:hypothetical protein